MSIACSTSITAVHQHTVLRDEYMHRFCSYVKGNLHQYETMLYFEDDHLTRNVSVASGPSDRSM